MTTLKQKATDDPFVDFFLDCDCGSDSCPCCDPHSCCDSCSDCDLSDVEMDGTKLEKKSENDEMEPVR